MVVSRESAYLSFAPYITAKNLIRALLDPFSTRRLTAKQALALSHTWLMSFAPLMEHGLSGVRENFDPRDPGATQYKSNGANTNKEDQLALWR